MTDGEVAHLVAQEAIVICINYYATSPLQAQSTKTYISIRAEIDRNDESLRRNEGLGCVLASKCDNVNVVKDIGGRCKALQHII